MSSIEADGSPDAAGGAAQDLRRGHALVLLRREAAGEDGLADQGQGDAQVERRGDGPLAGPLLPGGVEDQVDHGEAAGLVGVAEDVAGDLDQVAVERPLVPAGEDVVHGGGRHAVQRLHELIGLADQLHVAVFDAVVDHLDVVAGPLGADPVAAGGPVVDLGGDRLEDRLDVRPGVGVAPGHDRRPLQRPFLAPGDPRADEEDPLLLQGTGAPGGVGVVGVAAVDQDVARLEQGDQLVDHRIDGGAGLDHDHDLARPLERADQLGDGVAADDLLPLPSAVDEVVDLGRGPVEDRDRVAVALHVQHEVLAHHGQADQADVGGRFRCVHLGSLNLSGGSFEGCRRPPSRGGGAH